MADRSVSVPMTLSDLERRDVRVKFFRRISLITLVPLDLERPKFGRITTWGHISRGQPRPHHKEQGLSAPQFLGFPSIYAYIV